MKRYPQLKNLLFRVILLQAPYDSNSFYIILHHQKVKDKSS